MFRITRLLTPLLAIAALTLPVRAQMPAGPVEALDGIDPVQLIQTGKEVQGKAEFKVVRGRYQYLFASADSKAAFEKAPETYEIQLGGACARMGPSAGGNPSDYVVFDGKIYIFGSDDCHKKFAAAPAKFIPKPVPPMPTSAASAQQGRALLDRAVKALGGAERLDSLTTYVESSSQVQKRDQKEATITIAISWRFPDAVRQDRTMVLEGKTMTNAQLMTGEGAWFIGQGGRAFPMRPEGRPENERELGRQLVPLLRSRSSAGFKVAALPAATVEGTKVERARVVSGPVDVTLNLEPGSGRVHSLSFVGRNPAGEIGEITVVYSDYRPVDGLTLPFDQRFVFDGVADAGPSRHIDSIKLNAPLDPKLFAAPASGSGQ